MQNTYNDAPVHEDYQRTESNAETQWNEKDETVVKMRRADIDDSLYGEHPDNPPTFLQDESHPKPTSSSKTEKLKPAMNLSSGMSQRDKEDEHLYANTGMTKSSAPTVASPSINREGVGVIPGLGEPLSKASPILPVQEEEKAKAKSANAENMLASLGKLMTELQGLKGLTSSLQLLNALPQVKKDKSDQALSEEANKKAAALLANESDSDGESQVCFVFTHRLPVY